MIEPPRMAPEKLHGSYQVFRSHLHPEPRAGSSATEPSGHSEGHEVRIDAFRRGAVRVVADQEVADHFAGSPKFFPSTHVTGVGRGQVDQLERPLKGGPHPLDVALTLSSKSSTNLTSNVA